MDCKKLKRHDLHAQNPPYTSAYFNNEDLKCNFCGLQMENPKLLEIHMRSCIHRSMPTICKLCKNPIGLRALGKHYCAQCSRIKEGNQDYDLRFKPAMQNKSLSGISPRHYTVPGKNAENHNFATVTDARSSLLSARQKIAPMSDSEKPRKVKLKRKFSKHQLKEKQTSITNPKICIKEANVKKQTQVGVDRSCDLHHTSGKLSKISRKNVLQQKKCIQGNNAESSSEKLKNNISRKLNLKTSKQTDQRMRQTIKKNDPVACKSNSSNEKVTVKLLLDSIPEDDCAMLLHSSSANKMDHFYKCCRCGKSFKSIKLGSNHFINCKSNKLLNTEVSCSDVKWVCTICQSPFLTNVELLNHSKVCSIFTKKYDRACEKRCEKCHFSCLSSLHFQKHDCTKELESMKTCAVRLNPVKINSSANRVVMRECEFCSEIFDEQFTEEHFQSHHPGELSSGNFKQFYVNINPGSFSDTVVVKTEPVSPIHEFVSSGSYNFQGPDDYPTSNNNSSFNPVSDNISMPPPTSRFPIFQSSANLPSVQSTVSLPPHQPSSSHSTSDAIKVINKNICKCGNRSNGIDTKPCIQCLSQIDITKLAQNFKVIPFRVAKIKKETSEDLEASKSSTQAGCNTPTPSVQNGEALEADSDRNVFNNYHYMNAFSQSPFHSSILTPPSSHGGISPPATPLVQSFMNGEPCSASDVSMGSLNDISIVSDMTGEPQIHDALLNFMDDDRVSSPGIPLMQDDDQEIFASLDSCILTHLWDVESYENVDAWALVPSEGSETVEKYICSACIAFSTLDRYSIIKHLSQNHKKKNEYLAMYITKIDPQGLDHKS